LSIVLGIDGGGTNTRAVVADGEKILGRARGGSIKRLRVGAVAAEANLRELLRVVFETAGVTDADSVAAVSCGVASASMPGVAEWIKAVFDELGIRKSEVVGDEVIALDAAFRGGPGILQIAGTGSNCIGRTASGARESVGGYSSTLGDEGSGYWIGLHGVREALKSNDAGEPGIILQRVGEVWGTATLEELVHHGNEVPGPDFSALAPVISLAAEDGDAVARKVLERAAADLAEFVLLVRRKLRERRGLQQEVPVAFTGSVLEKTGIVRRRFIEILGGAVPAMPVAQEGVVAVEGALWRARRMAES
jgi:glucosamine kinase